MSNRRTSKATATTSTASANQLVELITALSNLNEGELTALLSVVNKQTATHYQPKADSKSTSKKSTTSSKKPQTREEALTAKYGSKEDRIAYLKSVGRYSDPSKNDDFNKAWSNYVAHCKTKGINRTKDLNRKVAAEIRKNGYKFSAKMLNA